MFSIGEKPTGSKDPFALRRAALGIIALIVENSVRLPLTVSPDVLEFLVDRLNVKQREGGVRHDLIDAVFSAGGENDLLRLMARVVTLNKFLVNKDGANLLAGYKRAVNIVKIEEKKDGTTYSGKIDAKLLKEKEELALFKGLEEARGKIANVHAIFWDEPLTVTSTNDGRHKKDSLHYAKNEEGDPEHRAEDYRLPLKLKRYLAALKRELSGCDIVLEKDHLHVEYDPKL